MKPLLFAALLCAAAAIPSAMAREGSATGSTIEGRNTVQQAPPGGSMMAHAPTGDGRPTPDDRRHERQDDAASQIRKGC